MIMRSTYLPAIMLLVIIVLLIPATPCAQPDPASNASDSLVDLKIIVELDSIPENLLPFSQDSTILISVYKGQDTTNNPDTQCVCTLNYHESQTTRMISIEGIPLDSYTVKLLYDKYGVRQTVTKKVSDEKEFRFNLTPSFFKAEIYANPKEYRAHCDYRRIKNDNHYIGDSNRDKGIVEISLLGKIPFWLVLETHDPDIDSTVVWDYGKRINANRKRRIELSARTARPFNEIIIDRTDE